MTSSRHWVLHDYLQVNGGAERLVITLTESLPDFALGVSGIYPGFSESGDLLGLAPEVFSGVERVLPRIPRALLAFSRSRREISLAETVIYSGIYAPLAVRSQPKGRKILYCHTPPRFAFDLQDDYLVKFSPAIRPLIRHLISAYRHAYLHSIRVMDQVVTNSLHVRRRFFDNTGVDSIVIYPPIDIEHFRWLGQADYYLSLGRLEPNKRVDQIVRAFLRMPDRKLVVASGGSELSTLKKLASSATNIHFTGWIDNNKLAQLVGNAIACLYIPKDEDFGMSAVEAMAAGKPVISVNEGGLRESVIHDQTGLLLEPNPSIDQIIQATSYLSSLRCQGMRIACESRAKEFSKERFLAQMHSLKGLNK